MKTTLPGFCAVDMAGDPAGNTHEYWAAAVVVAKETDPPAGIDISEAGVVMVPRGGGVA